MKKRFKMSKKSSKKDFRKGVNRLHKKNLLSGSSMINRGGIRL